MSGSPVAITRRLLERTEAELRERRWRLTHGAYGCVGPWGQIEAIRQLVEAREQMRRSLGNEET